MIIGSYKSISSDVAEMLALQKFTVDYVSKNNFLQKMINTQTFRFFVTDKVHAKIYLLKSDDGRCRVILTSANFSANAWQKRQMENFVVMDEAEAYEKYFEEFEALRRISTDEIDVNVRPLQEDGTNLERLPAIREAINSKTAVVVHELPAESKKESEYIFAQAEDAKKFQSLLKKSDVEINAEGQTLLTAEKVVKMHKIMKTEYEERQEQKKSTRQKIS